MPANVGKTISFQVTASNSAGNTATSPTAVVAVLRGRCPLGWVPG
jgi:hypothetical protein